MEIKVLRDLVEPEYGITLTFGDVAESMVGGSQVHSSYHRDHGFTFREITHIIDKAESLGFEVVEYDLSYKHGGVNTEDTRATVLVIKNFTDSGFTKAISEEQLSLTPDVQYYSRRHKRVVNKRARYNLCFGEETVEPDLENNISRVVSFSDMPELDLLRSRISTLIDTPTDELVAEGNYYYNINKCGIGFHGDAERHIVVGYRIGCSFPLVFQWYHKGEKKGESISIELNEGDLYIMSDKAVGRDWRRRVVPTLRHAAGCDAYTVK